ncbi:MAG: HYR domain-containing protein, partial [Verrucomicrobiota bacterium]
VLGSIDGTGSAARFSGPTSVAVDASGNVYVADSDNCTIRKITSAGIVSTFAGSAGVLGSIDGTGSAARFSGPTGVAVDSSGSVYVADTGNHTIRKISSGGVVTTLAGSAGLNASIDGTGSSARFSYPRGVAVDSAGNVYVADSDNRTIRKITSDGVVTTLAGSAGFFISGNTDGTGTGSSAWFRSPNGVAVDASGNVYVADPDSHTIRKISSGGVVTTLAGSVFISGSTDGTGSAASFFYPSGVVVDASGNVYVADSGNCTIRKISSAGVVTTLAGIPGIPGFADGSTEYSGSTFPIGTTPVTYAVADAAGNTSTASFTVTVRDTTPPTLTLPSNVTASATSASGATVTYPAATATDNVTANPTITYSKASGTVFPIGASTVTVTATDAANNIATGTFTVTVSDTTPPELVGGFPPITVEATSASGAIVNYTAPTATDNVGVTSFLFNGVQFFSPNSVCVDGSGTVYVADSGNHTIRKITSGGVVTTLAGRVGVSGREDGTGVSARFFHPVGLALDGNGNIYVADSDNHTIRKITSSGVVTTLAGSPRVSGSADDTGGAARFYRPNGVAVDGNGNIYVADSGNRTIRKITSGGVVTTLAGSAGVLGSVDGTGSAALFNYPASLCVDGSGSVYVVDNGNHTIRKITSGVVTTLAGSAGVPGSVDGTGSAALFNYPVGVCLDGSGSVYVADSGNNTIRKITSGGVVTTLAGSVGVSGSVDGTGSTALFNYPVGVAVDGGGSVYVADSGNCTIRKITSIGVVTTLAGTAGVSGSSSVANPVSGGMFPVGKTVVWFTASDAAGNISRGNFRVNVTDETAPTVFVPSNVTVEATSPSGAVVNYTTPTATDNVGVTSLSTINPQFSGPNGVAVDGSGALYVADQFNHTIRKITSGGVVTTLAGSAGVSGSVDGTGSAALFDNPVGVAVDGNGGVYVADGLNHTIRKITNGGVVTTLAGSAGVSGSVDGIGSAALFNYPAGVAVDGNGGVYVADSGNNTIRKITSSGVVTTLAGSSGVSGSEDGIGGVARFSGPSGLAVDGNGSVYVADFRNNTIRKITSDGEVTTLAGSAGVRGSADGTGSAARFSGPNGLALDRMGNVYVALSGSGGNPYSPDSFSQTIRKITSGGVVTTLAGSAGVSGSSDGTGNEAKFTRPSGLAVDGNGTVYVGDLFNYTIRKITSGGVVTTFAGSARESGSADGLLNGASGSLFPLGTTIVTVAATDAATNVSTGTFTVTVSDTTAPVIALPSNVTVAATSASGATVTYPAATATDNVMASPTITYSNASGTLFPIGVTTVTVTATDGTNPSNGTFTVTVTDPSAPVFAGVPANFRVEATSSTGAVVAFVNPTASDNRGAVSVVSSVASGSVFPVGATTVTFSAHNPVTNKTGTASCVVTVSDRTAPVLSLPSSVTVQATNASGAIVTYPAATATDAVTVSPTITYSQASGTTFPIGTSTVTVTVTDGAGNSRTGSFAVTVIDTIAPVISGVPANITAKAAATNGAVVTYTMPTATDAVGVTSLVASKASGSTFPMGTTTVTFTARDAANNTSTASFDVTVVDATSPVLEGVPANRTVEATSASGAVVDYVMPTASDVTGALTVVADKTSGSLFPFGKTTVTFTATSAATAKTTTASFTVTVSDTTAPVLIGLPTDMTVSATSASGATVNYTMPTATDAVGVTSLTASKESGSVFAIGATVVTVEAKDAAGHVTTGSFTVTVKDDAAPVIVGVPKNIIAKATSKLGAVVEYVKPTASDVVDGSAVEVIASKESGNVFPVGVTTVTFTATDAAHNKSRVGFTVTVKDTVGPALDGILTPLVLNTDASGKVALPDYTAQVVTSSDVVGGVKQTPAAGTLVGAGKTKVVLSVVDAAGRSAMLNAVVEVRAFPHITLQPENAQAWKRSKASFSVVAEGYGQLHYQWKKDGEALPNGNKAFYEVKKAFASDAGIYTVEVSNEVGSVESRGAELSFVSLSELEGTYQGLLSHAAVGALNQPTKPGRVTVTLNKTGALSGQLEYLGNIVRFNDELDSDLRMESRIERNGLSALDFSVELDPESKRLLVKVTEVGREFVSEATLAVAPEYRKGGAAQVGRYTMLFHEGAIQGAGYLATEVSSKGRVMFVGKTATGDELTGSAVLQADGSVACYFPLYSMLKSTGGYLGGDLDFAGTEAVVRGSVEWFKPEQTSKQGTTVGFLKTLSLESSRYVVPEKKAPVLAATTGQLSLKLSGYSDAAVVVFGAGTKVEVVHQPAGATVELTVSRATGVVSGTVTDAKTKAKRVLGGVVLQEQGTAGGLYLTEAGAGQWVVKQTE